MKTYSEIILCLIFLLQNFYPRQSWWCWKSQMKPFYGSPDTTQMLWKFSEMSRFWVQRHQTMFSWLLMSLIWLACQTSWEGSESNNQHKSLFPRQLIVLIRSMKKTHLGFLLRCTSLGWMQIEIQLWFGKTHLLNSIPAP